MYHPNSFNLTKKDEENIQKEYKNGVSITQLSHKYKVSTSRIRKIVRGEKNE